MSDDARSALIASAGRLGISPLDLATVISYETGGTFSPSIRGGAGNRHIGLIQFGGPEQRQYGASQDQTFGEQLGAVERYLTDRGLKSGMGRLDLYSTINAGRPGLYNASDAGNGGAAGSVADKVRDQMGAHERKASAFLGGSFTPQMPGETARSGRFGLSGVEGSAAPAPQMGMPSAATDDCVDFAKLLAMVQAPSAPARPAPQPEAPVAPEPPAVPQQPAAFDAERFYALLGLRAPR